MFTLTRRQTEVLEFIRDSVRSREYGPTIREIGDHLKVSSPNGVIGHLKALEAKGAITRDPLVSRGIRLLQQEPKGLPLVGRISAGVFHEAIGQQERIDFDSMLLSQPLLCAYRAIDDSMNDQQIMRGDYVIYRTDGRIAAVIRKLDDDCALV